MTCIHHISLKPFICMIMGWYLAFWFWSPCVYVFSSMYSNFSGSTLKLKSHIYSAEYLAWPHIIIGAYEHTWSTGSCAILTSLCVQSVVFFYFFLFFRYSSKSGYILKPNLVGMFIGSSFLKSIRLFNFWINWHFPNWFDSSHGFQDKTYKGDNCLSDIIWHSSHCF